MKDQSGEYIKDLFKSPSRDWVQWLTHLIPPTQEAENWEAQGLRPA
jgi:predicted transposase YdaD